MTVTEGTSYVPVAASAAMPRIGDVVDLNLNDRGWVIASLADMSSRPGLGRATVIGFLSDKGWIADGGPWLRYVLCQPLGDAP